MSDKDMHRYLMAHPDYWKNEYIRKAADMIGKKIWDSDKRGKIIIVSLEGAVVLRGTAEYISKRSVYTVNTIRGFARQQKHDRYGKLYQYEECDEEEMSEINA